MKKNIVFILLAVLLMGCNAEKRAAKKIRMIQAKHPSLFSEKRDTLIRIDTLQFISIVPDLDTIVQTSRDTIVVQTERIKTIVEIDRQEVPVYHIRTEVKNDTIEVVRIDSVFTIQKQVVTEIKTVTKIPWWVVAICIGCLGIMIFFIVKSG